MSKVLLVCVTVMGMFSSLASLHAQVANIIIDPIPEVRGRICYYMTGHQYYTDPDGVFGMEHGFFCCYDNDVDVARQCVVDQMIGWEVDEDKGPVNECNDDNCTQAGIRTSLAVTNPPVVISLRCCGCNGQTFKARGVGSTWCLALADAKKKAVYFGNLYYGGLKCYFPPAKPVDPCQPAPTCCKPKHTGLLRRLLGH